MNENDLPYPTEGRHRIIRWCSHGPSIVVARTTLRGKPWARFVRKIGLPGWHATCFRTLGLALGTNLV